MILALAAISLGFLGSFHCIGMCGPIALALPLGKLTSFRRFLSILLYNFGRILIYAFFGLIFGTLGKSFAIFGYQQLLSVTLGILILIGVLVPQQFLYKSRLNIVIYSFFSKLKNKLSALFREESKKSLFLIGILNGLLPCGLIYMALAASVATADIFKSVFFMSVFGLGTLPAMTALPFFGNKISSSFRGKIRKSVPLLLSVMALMLILRGLNLGIPYLSPKLKTTGGLPGCHVIKGKKSCSGLTK